MKHRIAFLFILIVSLFGSVQSCTCEPQKVATQFRCAHIQKCCGEALDEPRIDYLSLHYCTFNHVPVLSICILVLFVVYTFSFLDCIIDGYFASVMGRLAKVFRLSHNVAGVTFMALGNGAAELFSSSSAVKYKTSRSMGFSSIPGSIIFISLCGTGLVNLVSKEPVRLTPTVFIRDWTFSVIAVITFFFCFLDNKIVIGEVIAFVLLYGVYLVFVFVGECYRKTQSSRSLSTKENERKPLQPSLDVKYESTDTNIQYSSSTVSPNKKNSLLPGECSTKAIVINSNSTDAILAGQAEVISSVSPPGNKTIGGSFSQSNQRASGSTEPTSDSTSFESSSSSSSDFAKDPETPVYRIVLYYIYRLPVVAFNKLLYITIPKTSKKSWDDDIATLNALFSPMFLWFAFGGWNVSFSSLPSVWIAIAVSFAYVGATVISIRLKQRDGDSSKQPVLKILNVLVAFLVSIMWLNMVADELVNVCITIGIIFEVNLDVLGITVMVWGNGMDELLSSCGVAKRNLYDMAFGAIYGGINFIAFVCAIVGLLVGFHKERTSGGVLRVQMTGDMFLACIFGAVGLLVIGFWVVVINQWHTSFRLGVFCLVFYAIFLVFLVTNTAVPFVPNSI